ncbi:MAG: nucleoside triphosphate pyrophosphohydrolase [Rhodothermales bacterium]|nr:nucleoside triphosphate pyrophosphohydrolase [Rhodothermales bacterium]
MAEKIYDRAFLPTDGTLEKCADFIAIVRQLRRDCPWDREQTHESIRHLLIEECYEAVDAIDRGDLQELKRELGDLFLHVIFNAVIAEQDGSFNLDDILESESEKLIRRHPHVFGDTSVSGTDEVLKNWEAIKLEEGRRSSVLDGVPSQLPSLLRSYRIQEKVAGVGFDFDSPAAAWKKVEEELGEFAEAQSGGDRAHVESELGDVFFALVNFARLSGWNPENALRETNNKFSDRFKFIERSVADSGKRLSDLTLEEMDVFWDAAKEAGL